MKFHDKTPVSILHLISGILPAEALIQMRVLSLFGMICGLPENILYKMAEMCLLTENDKWKSWFVYVFIFVRCMRILVGLKMSKRRS